MSLDENEVVVKAIDKFPSILTGEDINECSVLFSELMEFDVDKSEQAKKAVEENFQLQMSDLLTKYSLADTPEGDVNQKLFHSLSLKSLLFVNQQKFFSLLSNPQRGGNGNDLSLVAENILEIDKKIFEQFEQLLQKKFEDEKNNNDLKLENENLKKKIEEYEGSLENTKKSISSSSSSTQRVSASNSNRNSNQNNSYSSLNKNRTSRGSTSQSSPVSSFSSTSDPSSSPPSASSSSSSSSSSKISGYASGTVRNRSLDSGAANSGGGDGGGEKPWAAPIGMKVLTSGQLEAQIEEIYREKAKHELTCVQNKVAKDSMADFLVVYFEKKYGLRTLVNDNILTLLHYTSVYAPQSNTAAIFKAVLNNEIDEDFRHVEKELGETLSRLIGAYLRDRYPSETEKQIETRKTEKIKGGRVTEDEWMSALKFMYNDADVLKLQTILTAKIDAERRRIEAKRTARAQAQARAQGKGDDVVLTSRRSPRKNFPPIVVLIPYAELLKTILDFQLAEHVAYLQPFSALFSDVHIERAARREQFLAQKSQPQPQAQDPQAQAQAQAQSAAAGAVAGAGEKTGPGAEDEEEEGVKPPTGPLPEGAVDRKGFRAIYKHIADLLDVTPTEKQAAKLLETLDPFKTNVIVYNDCVRAFSDEIEKLNKKILFP